VVGLEAEDIRIDNRWADSVDAFLTLSEAVIFRIIRDEREGRKMREIDLSELLD
jgi:hypothetical protein